MRHTLAFLALLATPGLQAAPGALDIGRLAPQLEAIANQARPATFGIAVRELDSGRQVMLYGGQRFPMQSVFKLALAVAALDRVDRGELSLEEEILIGVEDISPGWSPLAADIRAAGELRLSVAELIRQAQVVSDNTATDMLVLRLGGMAAVQRILEAKGIRGLRLDRNERELVPGVIGLEPDPAWTDYARVRAEIASWPEGRLHAALDAHLTDPRDTATPADLLELLTAIERGELLSPSSTARLRYWMRETRTGPGRLRAGLPVGWALGHKTGSSATFDGRTPTSNDVGIAYGPRGERIAIVALLRDSTVDADARDALIAAVAGAVVDALRE